MLVELLQFTITVSTAATVEFVTVNVVGEALPAAANKVICPVNLFIVTPLVLILV